MNLWRGVFAGFFGKIKSEALPVKISCLNGKGKYEYTLRGDRLVAMFTVKFTPTAAGMRIQVTQQDGQRYS